MDLFADGALHTNAHACWVCGAAATFGYAGGWYCREHRPAGFMPHERHLWVPRKDQPSYCVRCGAGKDQPKAEANCPGKHEDQDG